MENNIDKNKLNESLNSLLELFDESEMILKGPALPSTSINKSENNFENLVEKIANKTLDQENIIPLEIPNPSSNSNLSQMEGLSLSQRLKARLSESKIQNTQKNQNLENKDIDLSQLSYNELASYVMKCTHCKECSNRQNVLFGEGKLPSRLMVIGEGPGGRENATGRLFVGPSGDFLSKWLASIHLDMREDVYLSNIVKCWSGTNPLSESANYCKRYLERQIDFVKPQAILILGKVAANSLLNNQLPLNQMREKPLNYKNIPVIVTYHPAAVLRNEEWKRPVWNDLKHLASILHIDLSRR